MNPEKQQPSGCFEHCFRKQQLSALRIISVVCVPAAFLTTGCVVQLATRKRKRQSQGSTPVVGGYGRRGWQARDDSLNSDQYNFLNATVEMDLRSTTSTFFDFDDDFTDLPGKSLCERSGCSQRVHGGSFGVAGARGSWCGAPNLVAIYNWILKRKASAVFI